MLKKIVFLLLIYLVSAPSFTQSKVVKNYSPFMGSWVITGEAGLNLNFNDYENVGPGLHSRIAVDYYLENYSKHTFGPRFHISGGFLRGKDSRQVVDEYRTKFISSGLAFMYRYEINDNLYPYLSMGTSLIWFDPLTSDWDEMPNNADGEYLKTDILYELEIGMSVMIADNLSANISTGIHISPTDRFDDISVGKHDDYFLTTLIGVSYSLNGKKDSDSDGIPDTKDTCPLTESGIDVDENGCPVDTDQDGVPDFADDCPCTKEGVKVDSKGCIVDADKDGVSDDIDKCLNTPKGVRVDANGCPEDSDLDGVPDYIDLCEYTRLGVSVDANGCPTDSDKDGIADYLDKCPETDRGVKVDDEGCPIIDEEFVLSGSLTFASGQSVLLPQAFAELDKLADIIASEPNSRWRIEGHTDSQGSALVNYRLSLERANAVLEYFISKGLERSRFDVIRFGEDYPIADNSTDAGRAKNRRVVIKRLY